MSPLSKSRIKAQQDRHSSQELLDIYGSLLTPKQYAMTAGYCLEGKSFSQIAREQGVSRQAVHEAVRGVQRLLRYYEEKLKLKELPRTGAGVPQEKAKTEDPAAAAAARLRSLKTRISRKGVGSSPDWIVQELADAIALLQADEAPAPAPAAPARTPRKR